MLHSTEQAHATRRRVNGPTLARCVLDACVQSACVKPRRAPGVGCSIICTETPYTDVR